MILIALFLVPPLYSQEGDTLLSMKIFGKIAGINTVPDSQGSARIIVEKSVYNIHRIELPLEI